jgi:hypothetical protein
MHTAQALNNVPARYEPARLRRPTTPLTGRGCLLGLEINLSVTTAGPATDRTRVAGAAPAKALTTSPTVLLCSLRRLPDASRPPTPEGSQLGFPGGDVATPIRPLTGRPSLAPSSCTRSPVGRSCDLPTPQGEGYGLTTLRRGNPRGLGPASTPVARHPRGPSSERPSLATYLLVQACRHLRLVRGDGACGGSPGLTLPRLLGPDRLGAGSRSSGSRLGRHPEG